MASTTLLTAETALNAIGSLGRSTTMTLGGVMFGGMEVPDVMHIAGDQAVTVHQLPGGKRVIDTGGDQPQNIGWQGRFMGSNALARAQSIEALRKQGKAVTFAALGYSWTVKVRSFSFDYSLGGAVIPYQIDLVVGTSSGTSFGITSTSVLSALVGTGVTSALSTVSRTISTVSGMASSITGAAMSVLGQVTPIASLIGNGSALARAENYLTAAQGVTSTGVNLGNAASSLSSVVSNLTNAGTSLASTLSSAGANLESITAANAPSLSALGQNAAVSVGALESGQTVAVALKNANLAAGN